MKKYKLKKNPGAGFGIVLAGVVGGLLLGGLMLAEAASADQGKKPTPDGDGGGGDGEADDTYYEPVPGEKYKRGKNGKGRVYGTPNIALPAALFESNKVLVGPNCDWVVEGERFLPPVGSPSYEGNEIEKDTLFDTLQADTDEVFPRGPNANHAWGYAAYLVSNSDGPVDADALMQTLFEKSASLWKFAKDRGHPVGTIPVGGWVCAGSAVSKLPDSVKFWRSDMKARMVAWLNAYFDTIPFS